MPFRCCCSSRDLGWEASSSAARPASIQLASPPQPNDEIQNAISGGATRVLGLSQPAWESPRTLMTGNQSISGCDDPADVDFDSDDDGPRSRKGTRGTLNSVQSKLFQRNLHGIEIRRQSPVSIGNSDEELARRAELKRLMHKRIQDELFIEQSNPKANLDSSPNSQCLSPVGLHGAGPRDHIEFSVSTPPTLDSPTGIESGPKVTISLHRDGPENTPKQEGGSSISSLGHKSSEQSFQEVTGTVRRLCPEFVSSELAPTSRHASLPHSIISQRSFQLSSSTPRLERILGPDNGFSSRSASSLADGHSALGIWLIAQGLRSRENSIVPLKDSENSNSIVQDNANLHPKKRDLTNTSDVGIHSASASETENHLGRPLSITCSSNMQEQEPESRILNVSEDSKESPYRIRGTTPVTEDVLDGEALVAILRSVADNASSNYNSKFPSFQPSPSRSSLFLHDVNVQDLQSVPKTVERKTLTNRTIGYGNSSSLVEISRLQNTTIITSNKSDKPTVPTSGISFPNVQRPTSPSPSETPSFLQQEEELRSIQKRFGNVMARKKPHVHVISRFSEDFAEPGLAKPERVSLMNKIYLTIPARLKPRSRVSEDVDRGSGVVSNPAASLNSCRLEEGIGPDDNAKRTTKRSSHLTLRPAFYPLSSPVYSSPSSEKNESATGLWQRAFRLESEERRSSQGGASTSKVDHEDMASTSRSLNLDVRPWKGADVVDVPSRMERSDSGPSQPIPKGGEIQTDGPSKRLIQRWVAEMLPGATRNVENLRTSGSIRSREPPQSWSRYPSHTREKRTKYASTKDHVTPKDFAIQEIAPDGRVIWATDEELLQQEHCERPLSRSLSLKFGNAVKSKLARILPLSKDKRGAATRVWKRRAVSQEAKQLEYPELEILRTESGFKELQALEKEINNLKGRRGSAISENGYARPISTLSLGSRISARMHEVTTPEFEGRDSIPTATKTPKTPGTPNSHSLMRESVVLTDTFVTPQSRLSAGPETPRRESYSEPGSCKSERLTQKLSGDESLATIRPRSVTWTGQVEPEVSDSIRLERLRNGLNIRLQSNHPN
ncbi:hypothetical protein B0T10DRAFT_583546 [Thelonectria olida]|uniref:Uncharacterized protein n=1 Tax=Thelonectria olida TaxID=1576542 RepID=A0A9P8WDE4_9HYPO|nr:hypothetical protein B0T10DRAFT_583546 [Thelonectria olida]